MNTADTNSTNRRSLWQIEKMRNIIEERWEEVSLAVEAREFGLRSLHSKNRLITSTLKK